MPIAADMAAKFPADTFANLERVDKMWQNLRQGQISPREMVVSSDEFLKTIDIEIAIAGGTLGIILAAALQQRGMQVVVIERGELKGRVQEWNISRAELAVLVELELLSEAELALAIATEYNPGRIAFPNTPDIWVRDVLNIGVDPVYLLATLKAKFLERGGRLLEFTACDRVTIHPNGVEINTPTARLTSKLFIDAMGHFSPLAAQARAGVKPEGICLVVGSCATGFERNETGDIFATITPIQNQCQYFWEAFPARDGRTTYLFTYMDAHPDRFSIEFLFNEYLRLLPTYQQVELSQLNFQRCLFGCFPSYRNSPLKTPWARILLIGDSSGSQSPVSFGGFGAMIRHLSRLTDGIEMAMRADALTNKDLQLLQPYQPNIAVTWMFQRAMSVPIHSQINPDRINNLLTAVFRSMNDLGDNVLRPFLQDVVQFPALSRTLGQTSISSLPAVLPIVPHVGVATLLDWLINYINLGVYTGLYPSSKLIAPLLTKLSPSQQYYYQQVLQAYRYGSGKDLDI
ncbi:FAD-dependent oxidoreductase [Chamaesiphon polymorphus]|uniref:FAD-dependent oxidoreductase n=1 Tax=Chamaesiphon polymorphus CCALA 037 TaxID=2107692 RepID=A0A2T1FBC7_9CYAN|nr:FAD-dependent oxidoreductase [Chamaesiphon polymorphus]PSB42244.1 FAD-dependent oxidoreductase [Chamaesiphon polymorphus CCALA 037]